MMQNTRCPSARHSSPHWLVNCQVIFSANSISPCHLSCISLEMFTTCSFRLVMPISPHSISSTTLALVSPTRNLFLRPCRRYSVLSLVFSSLSLLPSAAFRTCSPSHPVNAFLLSLLSIARSSPTPPSAYPFPLAYYSNATSPRPFSCEAFTLDVARIKVT